MQTLDFVGFGPHAKNSRNVSSVCCHGNNYSHFNPIRTVWVHFIHVFEIFLAPLNFFYLERKFSLRNSVLYLCFYLRSNCTDSKWRILKKICQNWAKFRLLYLCSKVRYGEKIFTFANLLVIYLSCKNLPIRSWWVAWLCLIDMEWPLSRIC